MVLWIAIGYSVDRSDGLVWCWLELSRGGSSIQNPPSLPNLNFVVDILYLHFSVDDSLRRRLLPFVPASIWILQLATFNYDDHTYADMLLRKCSILRTQYESFLISQVFGFAFIIYIMNYLLPLARRLRGNRLIFFKVGGLTDSELSTGDASGLSIRLLVD